MPLCAATGEEMEEEDEGEYPTLCLRDTVRCPNQKCYNKRYFEPGMANPNAIGYTPNQHRKVVEYQEKIAELKKNPTRKSARKKKEKTLEEYEDLLAGLKRTRKHGPKSPGKSPDDPEMSDEGDAGTGRTSPGRTSPVKKGRKSKKPVDDTADDRRELKDYYNNNAGMADREEIINAYLAGVRKTNNYTNDIVGNFIADMYAVDYLVVDQGDQRPFIRKNPMNTLQKFPVKNENATHNATVGILQHSGNHYQPYADEAQNSLFKWNELPEYVVNRLNPELAASVRSDHYQPRDAAYHLQHVNATGDCFWHSIKTVIDGKFEAYNQNTIHDFRAEVAEEMEGNDAFKQQIFENYTLLKQRLEEAGRVEFGVYGKQVLLENPTWKSDATYLTYVKANIDSNKCGVDMSDLGHVFTKKGVHDNIIIEGYRNDELFSFIIYHRIRGDPEVGEVIAIDCLCGGDDFMKRMVDKLKQNNPSLIMRSNPYIEPFLMANGFGEHDKLFGMDNDLDEGLAYDRIWGALVQGNGDEGDRSNGMEEEPPASKGKKSPEKGLRKTPDEDVEDALHADYNEEDWPVEDSSDDKKLREKKVLGSQDDHGNDVAGIGDFEFGDSLQEAPAPEEAPPEEAPAPVLQKNKTKKTKVSPQRSKPPTRGNPSKGATLRARRTPAMPKKTKAAKAARQGAKTKKSPSVAPLYKTRGNPTGRTLRPRKK